MTCKSKAQAMTASSSTKAEFVVEAFTAAKTPQCPRFILQGLGCPQDSPVVQAPQWQCGSALWTPWSCLTVLCVRRRSEVKKF